jgi:hypothetical protein
MYAEKTRYDLTMAALEEVFAPGEVHYALYEQLTSPETLRPFCAFAGIDYHEPDPDRRVNESPKTVELPEAVVAEIAQHFAPVYAAVAARLPEVDLAAVWPSARHL